MTPLRGLFFREEVVLRQYIECKNAEDQKLLLDGLKRLSKSDPLVKVVREESGVHAILGSGELHLKACLRDLEEVFLSGPE
eukprot:CAMPEP_0175874620 /NCGR_PEP_ID=MMETSP0107_2-20121207/38994_1 /TAXON_ID=195067 ORGANISM="Goniomonas pacifica, Strain CCMP1869" /NCGR_SAMPLE_ID=MMETSP0107_2 /ASSEMBLY_ACC=CAM_ASM_000203 /LENGTH=80 /DNA_ID=CAMNT_0017193535 /DNA_START=29 /DNA_END=268 /DNA_ORIENTATION=+